MNHIICSRVRRLLSILVVNVWFILLTGGVQAQNPAPVDEYPIHADGGIIYDPLRREALKTGQLARYERVQTQQRRVKLAGMEATFTLPVAAAAYDVVPIDYTIRGLNQASAFPIAVQAVAFEDENRRRGRDLFDLALPGRIDMDFEYAGSITAHLRPGGRHNITPDFSDQPAEYPPFDRRPLVRSGVVEAGDLVWFKIRYTNTGNTILDPEGYSGSLFYPQLLRREASGEYEVVGEPYNLYCRDLEYLYPGETHETWIHFQTRKGPETPQNFGLIPGEYLLRMRLIYRGYKTDEPFLNIWAGPAAVVWDMPFAVEAQAREVPVAAGVKTMTDGNEPDKVTRFIHTFEEFMTAFDCYQAPPSGDERATTGRLHLQVAPWTTQVVVKLIGAPQGVIATAAMPLAVDTDSLKIRFNPASIACMVKAGRREPIVTSQTMSDMRANVQIGPYPEEHIRQRLKEMLDCGINVVSTTSMPWLYDDMNKPASNYQGDSLKYFLDCARREGMKVEGWGTYPFDRSSINAIAGWIAGEPFNMGEYSTDGYPAISHAEPRLPEANAIAWLYQFHRWGDLYCQLENGMVSLSVEDTRGWLRLDNHNRFPIGDLTIRAFQEWTRDKYKTIEAVNAAWRTDFASFEKIDPEATSGKASAFHHRWDYHDPSKPFHDWNQAIADFDVFRTELRIKNYRETMALVRKEIPSAVMCVRTEGANVLVSGISPSDPNPHYRHIYYSQRRCAIIADMIQQAGVFRFHSDYTTLPYTPSELRELVSKAVRQGIIPAWLPQFDNMRDIAINERYGVPYQVSFNLPAPKKGYMMHCLTAAYPWFAIMYEEGAIPGVLWEDYECDGFVTETQKRELRFFKHKLAEALNTPEAAAWRTSNVQEPASDWRSKSRNLPSYRLAD